MKSTKGMTLGEVLVATALTAVLALVAVSLFNLLSSSYFEVRERLEAEVQAARAENVLRNYFSQAIDVDFLTAAVPANNATQVGVIANGIDFDQIGDLGGNWATLAVFWRETATLQAGQTFGQPRETAMWYRNPSINTKGVLFISGGSDPGTNDAMTPSYNDEFIEGLTALRITKNRAGAYDKTASIDVTLRIRYHPSHTNGFNWCPELDIQNGAAGCGAIQSIRKDIERSFRIVLRNNLMRTASVVQNSAVDQEERTLGNLYFFGLVNPR